MNSIKPKIIHNNKKVCIIGAGPSGLTAANDLALRGYHVTVLEQFNEPGGMLRYGLPQFRLPYDVVAKDVKSITDLGVVIKTNQRIETEDQLKELKQQYDAVILAGGCMLPKTLNFDNINSKGFFWGLDLMMAVNEEQLNHPMKNVIVVGGGFTSIDCARIAYRMGAQNISIVFRRTKDDLTIGLYELEALESEGIHFTYLVSPVGIEAKNGQVTGLKLIRNSVDKNKSIKSIPNSEFTIEADTIIFAIGQKEESELFTNKSLNKQSNYFIAGDFRNGASTVIEAAADGRKVAQEVHRVLSNIKGYQEVVKINQIQDTGRIRDYDFIPRQPMDEIPLIERKEKNREVETGFSKEKSLIEARRCYLCHYNFQIDISRCIFCLKCIDVMPVDCIKMAKDIQIDKEGDIHYIETSNWSEVQAITIDNDKCIRCGNCVRACPVDCISISKYELEVNEK